MKLTVPDHLTLHYTLLLLSVYNEIHRFDKYRLMNFCPSAHYIMQSDMCLAARHSNHEHYE